MVPAGLTGNLVWKAAAAGRRAHWGLFLPCTVGVPEQHWQCPREKVCPGDSYASFVWQFVLRLVELSLKTNSKTHKMPFVRAKEIVGKCLLHTCETPSSGPQEPTWGWYVSTSVNPSTPVRWTAKRPRIPGPACLAMQPQTVEDDWPAYMSCHIHASTHPHTNTGPLSLEFC